MSLGELGFLQILRSIAPLHEGARGLMDDAAILEIGDETLVLTHDVIIEGVHVLPDMDEYDIAHRLVMSNISDLAAKGAEPVGALLGHSITLDDARFATGLTMALGAYGLDLLGGDTVRVPEGSARSWGLTAIGRARHVPVPSRSNAKIGHGIFVTGPIGAAMIAFEQLKADPGAEAQAYRNPTPRLYEGIELSPIVSAMMDISDGLLLDALRMGVASGVAMDIESLAVPLGAPEERRADALSWGDDYELLFTAPADIELPCKAYRIGTVRKAMQASLLLDGNEIVSPEGLGYQH